MFPTLRGLKDELDMIQSVEFETMATMILSVFDDVIENLDNDVDGMIDKLERLARMHAKVDGFHSDFFQVSRLLRDRSLITGRVGAAK